MLVIIEQRLAVGHLGTVGFKIALAPQQAFFTQDSCMSMLLDAYYKSCRTTSSIRKARDHKVSCRGLHFKQTTKGTTMFKQAVRPSSDLRLTQL